MPRFSYIGTYIVSYKWSVKNRKWVSGNPIPQKNAKKGRFLFISDQNVKEYPKKGNHIHFQVWQIIGNLLTKLGLST